MRYLFLFITSIFICFSCFFSTQLFANEPETSQTVIVVVGAGGTPEYQAQFTQWASLWEKACSEGNAKYISIGLEPTRDSNDVNDLKILHETIESQTKESNLPLWLIFIGHGTFDGRTAKFNMQGPDVSADDLAQMA